MKKEFLDYIYKLKSRLQEEIKRLVEINENSITISCDYINCQDEILIELKTRRSQLTSLEETIETYLKLHL